MNSLDIRSKLITGKDHALLGLDLPKDRLTINPAHPLDLHGSNFLPDEGRFGTGGGPRGEMRNEATLLKSGLKIEDQQR
jgi:hypothetical protein